MVRILVIEDDATFNVLLKTWLTKNGYKTDSVLSATAAKKALQAQAYDIVLSDLRLPDTDGLTLLKWIRQTAPDSAVFIMTGYADIQTAVQAMRLGALDYLEKPVDCALLKQKIDEILRRKERPQERIPFMWGESPSSRKLYEYMMLVAPTTLSVLISGDSGTGKEYVANFIHQNSPRRDGPFVAVDCGAIPKDIASSELFGHIKGSFTGAINDKKGAFEMANGGTLFLDEIGNLSPEVQMQLLRALQEGIIKPVGSNRTIEVNIRTIAATNADLTRAMALGHFREDLYHRIDEFQLHMPRLCDRGKDILLFADHFLEYANRQMNKHIEGFSAESKERLMAYPWPGNLRELLNVVRRSVLLAPGTQITSEDLPQELDRVSAEGMTTGTGTLKEQHERQMIVEALDRCGNNRTQAAQLLGIDRKTLYNKLKLYGLENG